MGLRRVVVTGMGVLSAVGNDNHLFFETVTRGRCRIRQIRSFDVSYYTTSVGAEIPRDLVPPMRELSELAGSVAVCILNALAQGGMCRTDLRDRKAALVLGTFLGEVGIRKIGQDFVPKSFDGVGREVAAWLGTDVSTVVVSTACVSGMNAIAIGSDLIRFGQVDLVLAGGYEGLGDFVYGGMSALRTLADTIRPFDARRQGTALGEGVGILLLESEESARHRKAEIHAEVLGYGLSNDAYHPLRPHPDGRGMAEAVRMALADSGISADRVDYINAHGTGTRLNDSAETRAIKATFGERAYRVPVSSIKPVVGHTLGAAGAIESIATVMAIEEECIPPTLNCEIPDPECDLDYVAGASRQKSIDVALSHSLGFGGVNGALAFGRYPSAYECGSIGPEVGEVVVSAGRAKNWHWEHEDGFVMLSEMVSFAREVLVDVDLAEPYGDGMGIVMDMSTGLLPSQAGFWEILEREPRFARPVLFCHSFPGIVVGELARELNITGPSLTLCDSSPDMEKAAWIGRRMLLARKADRVLVGKSDGKDMVMLVLERSSDTVVRGIQACEEMGSQCDEWSIPSLMRRFCDHTSEAHRAI